MYEQKVCLTLERSPNLYTQNKCFWKIQRPLHTLMMVTASSSENSVTMYQSTRLNVTMDLNINQWSLVKIKFHKKDFYLGFIPIPETKQNSSNTWYDAEFHGNWRWIHTHLSSRRASHRSRHSANEQSQHWPTRVVGTVGVFSCQTTALKTAPLTNTVLQFSNFNRDFEQIERNENILMKAKYTIEAPSNSNAPK